MDLLLLLNKHSSGVHGYYAPLLFHYFCSDILLFSFVLRSFMFAVMHACAPAYLRSRIFALPHICAPAFLRSRMFAFSHVCALACLRSRMFALSHVCALTCLRSCPFIFPPFCAPSPHFHLCALRSLNLFDFALPCLALFLTFSG